MDDINNFIIQGFHVYHSPNLVKLLDISSFGNIIDVNTYNDTAGILDVGIYAIYFTEEQKEKLGIVQHFLESNFLTEFEYYIVKCCIWDGVDDGSVQFHNDGKEHMNCTFLCYFSDTSEETGGALFVKKLNGVASKIYPQAGDIVWLNQDEKFQHKAERSSIPRIVAGFEYNIGF